MSQLLAVYFNEDPSMLYRIEDEVPEDGLPPTPILLVLGRTIAAASDFRVYIEGMRTASCPSFFNGIMYVFCCYYIFNMEYTRYSAGTLSGVHTEVFCKDQPSQKQDERKKMEPRCEPEGRPTGEKNSGLLDAGLTKQLPSM